MDTRRLSKIGLAIAGGCALLIGLGVALVAQDAPEPRGMPDDWSHHYQVFSNRGTYVDMLKPGVTHETWLKWLTLQRDPRFRLQQRKRRGPSEAAAKRAAAALGAAAEREVNTVAAVKSNAGGKKKPPPTGPEIPRDWSNVMGYRGRGAQRLFPAKFSFDTSTKDCANDFVVFPTATGGVNSSGTPYRQPGTFTAPPMAGDTITITNTRYSPSQVLTLTADASSNLGRTFAVGADATEAAANLAVAITRNGGMVGVTAAAAGTTVTITSDSAAVATTAINTTEALNNFTLGSEIAGTGVSDQPTIFALNHLYAQPVANGGCQTPTQATPAVMWAYNTTTSSEKADLSPVLSYYDDGAQVAFVQRGTTAVLVLLKWSATVSVGTLGAPTRPPVVSAAAYRTCSAPCMVRFPLGCDDALSAPFVDYGSDVLYIGDSCGNLHTFTGVFQGSPAEAGAPFAVVSSGNELSSPVFDPVSNQVFVGSNCSGNTTNCNRLHSVDATTGAVVSSGAIGWAGKDYGIKDSPIVDSAAQRVYAFISRDNNLTDSLGNACGSSGSTCASVYQFAADANLGTQDTGLGAGLGAKVILNLNPGTGFLNAGAFDNAYYSSADPASPTGALYACSGAALTPFRLGISSNSFASRAQGPVLGSGGPGGYCSPVTGFATATDEFIYLSAGSGTATAPGGSSCGVGGCLYSYRPPPAAFDASTVSTFPTGPVDFFLSVSTPAAPSTTESEVQTTITPAQAGTYVGMTVSRPIGSSFNQTWTLRKNGISQSVTCSTNGSGCGDSTHSVSLVAGDVVDVLVHQTSGSGTLTGTFRVQLGWHPNYPAAAALHANGGTGGIIVDNTVDGGGSQVYFSTADVGNTAATSLAVQASQAGLQ